MSNEQKHRPLTLSGIVRLAQAETLRKGYHAPTVIADGDRRSAVTWVEPLAKTHDARVQQMVMLGRVLAEQGQAGVLQQSFLIVEAWMNIMPPDGAHYVPPSQDPQHKEVLTVAHLSIRSRQSRGVVLEMKRNGQGKLMRLEAVDGPRTAVGIYNPLLEAFAIGFLGSAWDTDDTQL